MNNSEKWENLAQQVAMAMESRRNPETVAVSIFNEDLEKCDEAELVIVNQHCYKLLNVKRRIPVNNEGTEEVATDWYAVIDKEAYEPKSEIQLEVPIGKGGLFAGTQCWQLKKFCKMLDVKCVKVIETN